MKTCTKCKEEKELIEFYFEKTRNVYHPKCKQCHKIYQSNNKERNNKYSKEYYKLNKPEHIKRCTKYKENNEKYFKEYRTNYYQENKEILLEKSKIYQSNNKEKHYKYVRNKYKNDINFRLRRKLTTTLWNNLNKQNTTKLISIRNLLGCTIEECKQHLESQFRPEMTWENQGEIWEIDHIIPCSSFNLINIEEQQKCFHYTNLQPLFKTTEIAKSFGYKNEIGNRNKLNKF